MRGYVIKVDKWYGDWYYGGDGLFTKDFSKARLFKSSAEADVIIAMNDSFVEGQLYTVIKAERKGDRTKAISYLFSVRKGA